MIAKSNGKYAGLMLTALLATACAKDPPPLKTADLRPPTASLMLTPPDLPEHQEGDNYKDSNAQCRATVGTLTTQVEGLQGYVKTIRKKK